MRRFPFLVLVVLVAGCTTYRERPVHPAVVDAQIRARSLSDPGLVAYLDRHLPAPSTMPTPNGSPVWDLKRLTLAGLYFHPDLAVARAQLATANAGIRTAGAMPNPTVSISPGWESAPPPFLFNAALDLPIETAGKRERRIEQAQALSAAARVHIEEVAWQVRTTVRAALVDYLLTRQEVDIQRAEADARETMVTLVEQRLAAGTIAQPEVDLARIEALNAKIALRTAEGHVGETTASLAAAIGVSEVALKDAHLDWPSLDVLPAPGDLPSSAVQRASLLHRADLRRLVAEYAGAEAELKLQIAKQYPDIQISPGYAFDQGANKYTLGIAMTLPVFDQNQGPIGEAVSKRSEAAAQLLGLQVRIIGQTELALARYRSAAGALAEADRSLSIARQRESAMQQGFDAGREDRLALTGARVEVTVANKARLDVFRNAQSALGGLEEAMQVSLGKDLAPGDMPATDVAELKAGENSHE